MKLSKKERDLLYTGHSAVICLDCGTVLISNSRHAFIQCECPNETFVDGGRAYLRCGAINTQKGS